MKRLIFTLFICTFFMGCVSPAIGGRTKLQVDFADYTIDAVYAEDGTLLQPATQETDFSINVSAAAGVTIDEIASMMYAIDANGNYTIDVNGSMIADTSKQAEALKVIEALTAAERAALAPQLINMLGVP